jgi:hypothetical protein
VTPLQVSAVRELPPEPLPNAPPAWAVRAGLTARAWLLKLADAIVPAPAAVFDLSIGLGRTHLLGAAARFRLADLLGDDALTPETLARRAGLETRACFRMMRALAAQGVFRLRRDGRFENNRLSRALKSESVDTISPWVQYFSSS